MTHLPNPIVIMIAYNCCSTRHLCHLCHNILWNSCQRYSCIVFNIQFQHGTIVIFLQIAVFQQYKHYCWYFIYIFFSFFQMILSQELCLIVLVTSELKDKNVQFGFSVFIKSIMSQHSTFRIHILLNLFSNILSKHIFILKFHEKYLS